MNRLEFLKKFSLLTFGLTSFSYSFNKNQLLDEEKLKNDLNGILALPEGFSYQVISRQKDMMDDGLLLPPNADGMACFKGRGDNVILIRNHEMGHVPKLSTLFKNNPYGKYFKKYKKINKDKFFDIKGNKTHCFGGTTTIVYNTKKQKIEKQYLSLSGTLVNCSGGSTPWNTWITCEETTIKDGPGLNKMHGYNFEVHPSESVELQKAEPLKSMGRFRHEGVAFDPKRGYVYQTEDREDGLFYRFIPKIKNKLNMGGSLQALVIKNKLSVNTSNWNKKNIELDEKYEVTWIKLDDVDSVNNDLRHRGNKKGAASFVRGEGVWFKDDVVYFTATTGGKNRSGQIWKYNQNKDNSDGTLELFFESNDKTVLNMPDNIMISPWGDVLLCEDGSGHDRIVGIRQDKSLYYLAKNIYNNAEFAGLTFDPKGKILFVNIYNPTLTLAIQGPWKKL